MHVKDHTDCEFYDNFMDSINHKLLAINLESTKYSKYSNRIHETL